MSEATIIPNTMKIDGIDVFMHLSMHFSIILDVKKYQAYRNFHWQLFKIEMASKSAFGKINDMFVLFFGASRARIINFPHIAN
jgi:hypothetical protein